MRTPRFVRSSTKARLAAVAVATALSLSSLSACSGDSSGSGDPDSLTMWTFKQSHVEALKEAAAAFTKETGISVEVQAYGPDDAYVTKVQAAAKTGDLPDVLEVHSDGEDFALGATGIVKDMAEDVGADWSGRFQKGVQGSGTVTRAKYKESLPKDSKTHGVKEGQRFSVPLTSGTFGIVMGNKKKLSAAGITEPPASYEEFLDALKATTAKDPKNGGVSLGLKVKATGLTWGLQPLAFGELGKERYQALWSEDGSAGFSSPDGQKVLDLYAKLQPYWMPGTQTLDIDAADQAFAQGKSAWAIGGTFTLAFLQQNGMDPENVMAFGFPGPTNGAVPKPALAPLALTGLSVTSTSEQPENARRWMQFLAQPEVAAQFAKDATEVPSTELGADAASVMGQALADMTKAFVGAPESTYDPNVNDFRPPGYDQDSMAEILADLTPLKKKSVEATGADLAKLNDNFWASSNQ